MLSLLALLGITATIGKQRDEPETVNLANDGDFFQCNTNPSFFISDLSHSDREKVNELEFVQALFRHGTRMRQNLPYEYFPEYAEANPDWKIDCNITQIDGREYIAETANLKFRRKFVENEQYHKNSNCAFEQSLYNTIPQMDAISEIFKERYFGNKYQYKIFSKNDLKPENLQIYSTDTTRTVDSALYFTQNLLRNNNNFEKKQESLTIDLMIHDEINEPFRTDLNRDCSAEPQWIQWNERFHEAVNNKKAVEEFENSAFAKDVKQRYENHGGVWLDNLTPFGLAYHYCAGLDIPLPLDLWKDMEKYDVLLKKAYDDSQYGEKMNYCYRHIRSIPAYQVTLNAINEMKKKNKSRPKALFISSHGSPSMVPYLWGLNLYDHEYPLIAGLFTLEIYSANDRNDENVEYYFRWTRDGKFLPYPPCYDYYGENSELCDLQIMLDQDFNDVVPINEFNKNICPNAVDLCLCGLCDH